VLLLQQVRGQVAVRGAQLDALQTCAMKRRQPAQQGKLKHGSSKRSLTEAMIFLPMSEALATSLVMMYLKGTFEQDEKVREHSEVETEAAGEQEHQEN
jgi:hypothetical protein